MPRSRCRVARNQTRRHGAPPVGPAARQAVILAGMRSLLKLFGRRSSSVVPHAPALNSSRCRKGHTHVVRTRVARVAGVPKTPSDSLAYHPDWQEPMARRHRSSFLIPDLTIRPDHMEEARNTVLYFFTYHGGFHIACFLPFSRLLVPGTYA